MAVPFLRTRIPKNGFRGFPFRFPLKISLKNTNQPEPQAAEPKKAGPPPKKKKEGREETPKAAPASKNGGRAPPR